MKRKLTIRNKAQLSNCFKTRKQSVSPVKLCEQTTFASISASKAKGQQCYITRMRRQERMNPRQLKKCRKKQRKSGLTGSRYSGMCQSRLQPAGFKNHGVTDLLMNTKVKDWHIVSVYDKDQSVGRVLWGICTQDITSRFSVGDYVCTSRIIEIIPKENLVKTFSGNAYLVEGDGQKSQIQVQDLELLRGGLSPDEISFLTEEQKMELVKLRFSDLDEDDLADADTFFEDLDAGKYDF